MSARIKIDQVGLPAGVAGIARTDGLDTGDIVTLTDVSGTGNSTFHLLWGPPDDPVAEASLGPTVDPNVWTFEPNSGSEGSYLIELRENGDPVERRVFGIRTAANQLLIPALNERASRHANWENDGADQSELSDNNAIDFADADLNAHPYAGWWRSLAELYRVVEAGTGGIADHSLPLVKLALAPAKSVIANPLAVAGDADYLVGATEFQYLRVNAANNGLEWSTLAAQASTSILYDAATNTFIRAAVTGVVTAPQNSNTASFSVAAGKSVLINAANGSAVPAFVAGTAAFQYLRVNTGNNGLEWATLSAQASTSIVYDGASSSYQRAALTGAVTATQNSNATAFGSAAAKSVLINAGNASAVPAFVAGAAAGQYLRVNQANTGLLWEIANTVAARTTATQVNALTTVLDCTGSYTIPAGSLVAGTSYRVRFAFQFLRGATATALNLGAFLEIGAASISVVAAVASTVNGFVGYVDVEAVFTVLSTGVAGTAFAYLRAFSNATAGSVLTFAVTNTNPLVIDTTIANAIRGYGQMNAAVANTTINAMGGDVQKIN